MIITSLGNGKKKRPFRKYLLNAVVRRAIFGNRQVCAPLQVVVVATHDWTVTGKNQSSGAESRKRAKQTGAENTAIRRTPPMTGGLLTVPSMGLLEGHHDSGSVPD